MTKINTVQSKNKNERVNNKKIITKISDKVGVIQVEIKQCLLDHALSLGMSNEDYIAKEFKDEERRIIFSTLSKEERKRYLENEQREILREYRAWRAKGLMR